MEEEHGGDREAGGDAVVLPNLMAPSPVAGIPWAYLGLGILGILVLLVLLRR
jgi:hypothetical protein